MPDAPQSLSTLFANVERLLLQDEPDGRLETCHFSVRFGRDTGYLALSILPTVEQARSTFEFDGNRLVAPKSSVYVQRRDGTVTDYKPAQFDPPIQSSESLPNLGNENFVWRGYGRNSRGVIKLRIGRFLASLNAPTIADAERLARREARRRTNPTLSATINY
jgi:hypothetical protein